MPLLAVTTITAALLFYTTAVFWEKRTGYLRGKHLLLFVIGLICDITGTTLMSRIAGDTFRISFHGITGAAAIILMLIHVVWAIVVHASKRPEPKVRFRKYSLTVWALWLIPYFSGMIFGMINRS